MDLSLACLYSFLCFSSGVQEVCEARLFLGLPVGFRVRSLGCGFLGLIGFACSPVVAFTCCVV